MAIELDGKPLKFTAEFDSKQAEQSIEQFLNKIKDINSKGLSSGSAHTAAAKASGQYKSLLGDATSAFDAFSSSSKNFFAKIAQGEMVLQKVRNEQNLLNRELRQGIVSEEDFIKKTAKLNQVREELTQQLKNNRTELAQLSKTSVKPYSSADTSLEITNAFSPGNGMQNLSATEAFAKKTKQEIKSLNDELNELSKQLKAGGISSEEYAKKTEEIGKKLKDVNENQAHFNKSISENVVPTQAVEQQKSILSSVSSQYREYLENATSAFQAISPEVQALNDRLVNLQQESKNLTATQKEVDLAYKTGSITQSQYLESTRNLGIQQNEVKRRISDTRKEINTLDNIERKNINSIAEKTARLTQLQQRYASLSESQRKHLEVGGKIRQEYQALSKEITKLNSELTGSKSQGIFGAFSSIRNIAGAMGLAFSVNELVNFGKELFQIAKQAEGVQLAFARIGDTKALDKLKAATKDTVSELELMKLAVRAQNFKIPMDTLAKGLEFAQRRAKDTGQDVNYMVNSFVDGLGRKSSLVLDNLGISLVEIQKEVKKVGDYNIAVGNIIEREMAKAGDAVDTLSDKVSRASSFFADLKKWMSQIFMSNDMDPNEVMKRTEFIQTPIISIGLKSDKEERNKLQKDLNDRRKAAAERVKIAEEEYNQAAGFLTDWQALEKKHGKSIKEIREDLKKNLNRSKTELTAINNAISNVNAAFSELDTKDRKKAGIFSVNEIEEELTKARTSYNQALSDEDRKEAQKEIDKWQGMLDKVSLSKLAKQDKDLTKELERNLEDRIKLLERWAKTDADYLRKQLTRDEQEVQSVREKYAELKREIEKHNKETKGEKISLDGFDAGVETVVSSIIERQGLDKKLELYEEDYKKYLEYEELKKQAGISYAEDQLGNYKNVVEKMQAEADALNNKKLTESLSPNEEQYLKSLEDRLKEHNNYVLGINRQRFVDLMNLTESYGQKEEKIRKKYSELFEDLEKEKSKVTEKEYKERSAVLSKQLTEELKELYDKTIKSDEEIQALLEKVDKAGSAIALRAARHAKEAIKNFFKNFKPEGPEAKAAANALSKEMEANIDGIIKSLSEENYSNILSLVQGFDQLVTLSGQFDGQLGNSLKTIGAMVGEVGRIAQTLGKTIGKTGEGLSSAGGIMAIIGAAVSLIGGIWQAIDEGDQKREKEREERFNHYEEHRLKQLQYETLILEKQLGIINDIYGVERVLAYKQVLEGINKEQERLINPLKTRSGVRGGEDFLSAKLISNTGDKELDALIERYNRSVLTKSTSTDTTVRSGALQEQNTLLSQIQERAKKAGVSVQRLDKDLTNLSDTEALELQTQLDLGMFDEGTAKYIQAILDLREAEKEALKRLKEEITGTSIDQLLSTALNAFFQSGEDSAQAWSDGFDKVMEDYLIKRFSREYLEKSMQEWYEMFYRFAEDGLDDDERKELQSEWERIGREGREREEMLREATGIEKPTSSNSSKGGLSNAIAGITETTANRLEAEFGGLRIAQLQLLEVTKASHADDMAIANDMLLELTAIQLNTFKTANNTDRLANIEFAIVALNNKITSADALYRGGGY